MELLLIVHKRLSMLMILWLWWMNAADLWLGEATRRQGLQLLWQMLLSFRRFPFLPLLLHDPGSGVELTVHVCLEDGLLCHLAFLPYFLISLIPWSRKELRN